MSNSPVIPFEAEVYGERSKVIAYTYEPTGHVNFLVFRKSVDHWEWVSNYYVKPYWESEELILNTTTDDR